MEPWFVVRFGCFPFLLGSLKSVLKSLCYPWVILESSLDHLQVSLGHPHVILKSILCKSALDCSVQSNKSQSYCCSTLYHFNLYQIEILCTLSLLFSAVGCKGARGGAWSPPHILTFHPIYKRGGDRLCPLHYYLTPYFQTFLRPHFFYEYQQPKEFFSRRVINLLAKVF